MTSASYFRDCAACGFVYSDWNAGVLAFWQFEHPHLLWWLGILLIPLVADLIRRRPAREVAWSAMELLQRAYQQHKRRWRLYDRWRLFLRMMILAMVCLAGAGPQRWSGWNGDGTRHRNDVPPAAQHLIVLDHSLSMQAPSGNSSRFERAIQELQSILSEFPHDRCCVVAWDANHPALGALYYRSATELQSSLSAWQPGASRADVSDLIEWLDRTVMTDDPNATSPPDDVWVITDMQASTWQSHQPGQKEKWQKLKEGRRVQVIDVSSSEVENVAITDLRWDAATTQSTTTFHVTVENFGTTAAEREIRLLVQDEYAGQQRIDIPPRESRSAAFPFQFKSAGIHCIRTESTPDALSGDDRRFATVEVIDAIRVLCWEGVPDAARPFEAALLPHHGGEPTFLVERSSSPTLPVDARDPPEVLVLAAVDDLTRSDAIILQSLVRTGMGLVIVPGTQLNGQTFADCFGDDVTTGPFLPARIGPAIDLGDYHLTVPTERHPITKSFWEDPRGILRSTPVWRYYDLQPTEDAQVVLEWEEKIAAITARSFGKAHVILVGTPMMGGDEMENWNAWIAWPSFPPLARAMVFYARAGGGLPTYTVGDPLQGVSDLAFPSLESITPAGIHTTIWLQSQAGHAMWDAGHANEPGFYRFLATNGRELPPIAVNVDNRESDLTRNVDPVWTEALSRPSRAEPRRDQPLTDHWSRLLIGLALAILLLESWWKPSTVAAPRRWHAEGPKTS